MAVTMKNVGAGFAVSVLMGLVGCNIVGGADDSPEGSQPGEGTSAATPNPNGKGAGGECATGTDCKSGICAETKCTAPDADVGKDCAGPADCESKVCLATACQPAKLDDGVQNGDETDIDCGGTDPAAARCADDKSCKSGDDCESKVCDATSKKCLKPTSTDGTKNGDEGDVDCGGTLTGASKCAVGKTCNKHEDCTTDGCDDTKHCANGRSCTQANGGRTCGKGEVGAADATHESCCGSIAIPGRATKLDKYKITAGRMRAFVERTNGDALGWYEANKGSLSAAQRNQIEPYKGYLSKDLTSYPRTTSSEEPSTCPRAPARSRAASRATPPIERTDPTRTSTASSRRRTAASIRRSSIGSRSTA